MNLTTNLVWLLGLAILLGTGYLVYRMIKNRLDEQRYQEHLAELEFESSILGGFESAATATSSDAVFLQNHDEKSTFALNNARTDVSSFSQAAAPSAVFPVNDGVAAADTAARGVMEKLTHAGMISGIEGYVEVHGNPKGAAILRLRSGKLALLVPHMESEAFLRKNSRRVDMVIMTGTDGSAFVVRTLEDLVADSITLM